MTLALTNFLGPIKTLLKWNHVYQGYNESELQYKDNFEFGTVKILYHNKNLL